MAVKQVFLLDMGYIFLDKSILTAGRGYGQDMKGVVYVALLEHQDGWMLVDTGLNPAGAADPERIWGPRAKFVRPLLREENDIRTQLGKLGLSPKDIKYVIQTHLHFDHTGGNSIFPDAKFYVQKAEYRYAFCPDAFSSPSYVREAHFDCGVEYALVEGDQELMDGVFLLHTPGHTPGHQSVLVKLDSGNFVLIAGDALYTDENFTDNIPPGNSWEQAASCATINKLRLIQRLTGARVFSSHDPDFWLKAGEPPICLK